MELFLGFRFKSKIEGNGNDHNVRLKEQFINKMEKLKFIRSIVEEEGEVVDDIGSRIKRNCIKWSGKR